MSETHVDIRIVQNGPHRPFGVGADVDFQTVGAGRDQRASETVVFLKQHDGGAAFPQTARGLQTGGTASDDHGLQAGAAGRDLVEARIASHDRVYRTAEGLRTSVGVVAGADAAAEAGADLVSAARFRLVYGIGVCDQLTDHGHDVRRPVRQGGFGEVEIEASHGGHRDRELFLEAFRESGVRCHRQIGVLYRIAHTRQIVHVSRGDMDHIQTALDLLGKAQSVLDADAARGQVVAADPVIDGHVGTDRRTHGIDQFLRETASVLKGAASVFVRPLVQLRGIELRDGMAVPAVEHDQVEAGLGTVQGGVGEIADDLPDILC